MVYIPSERNYFRFNFKSLLLLNGKYAPFLSGSGLLFIYNILSLVCSHAPAYVALRQNVFYFYSKDGDGIALPPFLPVM